MQDSDTPVASAAASLRPYLCRQMGVTSPHEAPDDFFGRYSDKWTDADHELLKTATKVLRTEIDALFPYRHTKDSKNVAKFLYDVIQLALGKRQTSCGYNREMLKSKYMSDEEIRELSEARWQRTPFAMTPKLSSATNKGLSVEIEEKDRAQRLAERNVRQLESEAGHERERRILAEHDIAVKNQELLEKDSIISEAENRWKRMNGQLEDANEEIKRARTSEEQLINLTRRQKMEQVYLLCRQLAEQENLLNPQLGYGALPALTLPTPAADASNAHENFEEGENSTSHPRLCEIVGEGSEGLSEI